MSFNRWNWWALMQVLFIHPLEASYLKVGLKRKMVKLSLKAAKNGQRGKRQGKLSVVSKTLPKLSRKFFWLRRWRKFWIYLLHYILRKCLQIQNGMISPWDYGIFSVCIRLQEWPFLFYTCCRCSVYHVLVLWFPLSDIKIQG